MIDRDLRRLSDRKLQSLLPFHFVGWTFLGRDSVHFSDCSFAMSSICVLIARYSMKFQTKNAFEWLESLASSVVLSYASSVCVKQFPKSSLESS